MSDKAGKKFLVGSAGKRELRQILRATTDPATTIRNFQKTHSLHTMLARAFQTIPNYEEKEKEKEKGGGVVEPLDTDPVLMFLYHVGVSQHEIHKRVADMLKAQLEGEIRKARGPEPLLNLLRSCWQYSTSVPELRPVLWAVLRQLGSDTPTQVLERLAERDAATGNLKHPEVWHPLPPLLKRLAWEADWDKHMGKQEQPQNPKEYLDKVKGTLFAEKLSVLIEQYTSAQVLIESADRPFVSNSRERRVLTTQRRALSKKISGGSKEQEGWQQTSKAVTELRRLLSNGDTPAYRPKLLYAALSTLIAQHGVLSSFVGGSSHLHCTLLADILLSGPLPKAYLPVLSLARTLDEVVKTGTLADAQIVQMQASLRQIYPSEGKGKQSETTKAKTKEIHSAEVRSVLKRVITSGIAAMKEADPQQLFLNKVTDDLAPGYSTVIQKPMYMKKMEQTSYLSLDEWDKDVQLMYRNCIAYNTGNAGQWFRGEARRQHKVFKDDIFPQAKSLFEEEKKKIVPPPSENSAGPKRKQPEVELVPLDGHGGKKQKLDPTLPSMPVLTSMLLADPFVLRLLMDRALRSLRIDTWKGSTIPVAHSVVPSILQMLQFAQFSTHLCATRGEMYMVPEYAELKPDSDDPIPFQYVREFAPLILKLFLEAELDKRMAGDLKLAASSLPPRKNVISVDPWKRSSNVVVLLALVQGATVHVCQPGNSVEASLATTFPKFASALQQLASLNMWEEKPFFLSLIQAILRHKTKLAKPSRDAIVTGWLGWLKSSRKKTGSIMSPAHECFVVLLNEWAALGNLLLPRDLAVEFSQEAVSAVNQSEKLSERKFAELWKNPKRGFERIKEQYERLLKSLPEGQLNDWKEKAGIMEGANKESERSPRR